MNAHIKHQIIEQDGKPLFVIVPYAEYIKTHQIEDNVPHEVMRSVLRENYSLARAWREHLGLKQEEVAARMCITQPALAQIEAATTPRKATRLKLAAALGINEGQLI